MKMSMGPKAFLVASKAAFIAVWSTMSATNVRTLTPGCWASTSDLVVRRDEEVRPRMVILVEPEVAKAWVRRGPIPEPPPVIRTTFPAMESSGLVGEMAG